MPLTICAIAAFFLAIAPSIAEKVPVTCASTVKLSHAATKVRLHSHEVSYSRGSQQQSVTGFPTGDDANSYCGSVAGVSR